MKRLSVLIALLLAVSPALGCRRDPKGFMPLKTGRKSVYSVEYSNPLSGIQRAEAVVRVDEKKTIEGREYFRIVMAVTGRPGHDPEVFYQRFAPDGLHELRYVRGRPVDYLQTPWPLTVGQAWQVNAAGTEMTCRVDTREPAILPDRTYDDAYKISCYGSRNGASFKNETYLVEGVGAVRTVQELGSLTLEMRLKETE